MSMARPDGMGGRGPGIHATIVGRETTAIVVVGLTATRVDPARDADRTGMAAVRGPARAVGLMAMPEAARDRAAIRAAAAPAPLDPRLVEGPRAATASACRAAVAARATASARNKIVSQ